MQIKMMGLKDIKPYEKNPRRNDKSVEFVANSIKEFGFKVPIVIDKDGVIVCGHTRYKAAKKLKMQEVPCIMADDLTDAQIKAFRLADNKVGESSEWDDDLLDDELALLDDDFDMEEFGFGDEDEEDEEEKTREDRKREFRERMESGELSEDSEEYQEFLQKFEQKKTTDDCYTPDGIYEVVEKWAVERYHLEGAPIIRPFVPNGDYQSEKYPKGCVVIDNPPFSILSDICAWYADRGIRYFMFAPGLSLFSTAAGKANYVITGAKVTYENGAKVNTSFVTNLGDVKILVAEDLSQELIDENSANEKKMRSKNQVCKYTYPNEFVSAARLEKLAKYGIHYELNSDDVCFVRTLDAQKEIGKSIFGSGFLISEKAAAEKATAEKAAAEKATAEKAAAEKATAEKAAAEKAAAEVIELSDREKEIVKGLGKR